MENGDPDNFDPSSDSDESMNRKWGCGWCYANIVCVTLLVYQVGYPN